MLFCLISLISSLKLVQHFLLFWVQHIGGGEGRIKKATCSDVLAANNTYMSRFLHINDSKNAGLMHKESINSLPGYYCKAKS
jgi:hypothetical protein